MIIKIIITIIIKIHFTTAEGIERGINLEE
jgi:hypothetical protein